MSQRVIKMVNSSVCPQSSACVKCSSIMFLCVLLCVGGSCSLCAFLCKFHAAAFCISSRSHTFGLMHTCWLCTCWFTPWACTSMWGVQLWDLACFLHRVSWAGCEETGPGMDSLSFPPPTNRLVLRTFPSDWTKFLWKATRACGWHKVISRFAVTLKWYAICRTVNSPLPVTDRNWPGWGPHKMGFPVDVSRRAPKQVTWRGIKISRSSDCFKQ